MFVHFVRAFQRSSVFLREYHVTVIHEVEELVRLVHHVLRPVAVVEVLAHLFIDFPAVPRDSAQFKFHLFHQFLVPGEGDLLQARLYVDQTPQDAALRIGNLHRTVCRHKEKAVCTHGVTALELLVDQHLFMADNTVQFRVVLNPAQVAIMLNRHQRVRSERFGCKLVVVSRQRLCVKHHVISLKQFLDYIQDRALSRSGFAIEHQELLNITAVAVYN